MRLVQCIKQNPAGSCAGGYSFKQKAILTQINKIMKQTKSIATIAKDIENGNIYFNEISINSGNFESFTDFLYYFNIHYRPLLEDIRNGKNITSDRKHLLNFLADDFLKIFNEEN